jgi:hypothetical protein
LTANGMVLAKEWLAENSGWGGTKDTVADPT